MTKQEFLDLVASRPLLLDGATGSNLMKAGMPRGVCTEEWVLSHPEAIIALQNAYVEAGSDIVYAPTFSCNRESLARFGYQDRVIQMNTELASIALSMAKGRCLVAGDLTTTGYPVTGDENLSYEKRVELYAEQIKALADAGVDLLVAETLLGGDEAMAALDAAASVCELPMMCSFTVEGDGTLYFGGNILDLAPQLEEMGAVAVGVNCSAGPAQLENIVKNLRMLLSIPVIAKPNAGLPVIDDRGNAVYPMEPQEFKEQMKNMLAAGARLLGGCCGTDPRYIRGLKELLNESI